MSVGPLGKLIHTTMHDCVVYKLLPRLKPATVLKKRFATAMLVKMARTAGVPILLF
ncbi:hypothetical protein ACU8KH_04449 [Lachancea thermotolerans]